MSQSRCRVSARAKRPGGQGSRLLRTTRSSPDPIHDPAPSRFLGLKANPACGRSQFSGCSDAIHGSRFLKATTLEYQAACLGDWLPRSPRSDLAAHASLRSSVAFDAPTRNETVARLGGGVTRKRVAAHQRNATTSSKRWWALACARFFGWSLLLPAGNALPRNRDVANDRPRASEKR